MGGLRGGLRSFFGTTGRRLALVILLTSTLPLAVTLALANSLFTQASAIWFNPELGHELDRGIEVQRDYVAAKKSELKYLALAVAREPRLHEAVERGDRQAVLAAFDAVLAQQRDVFALQLQDEEGQSLAERRRPGALDEVEFREVRVTVPAGEGRNLQLSFPVPRRMESELEHAGAVVARYHRIVAARDTLYGGYLQAFAVLIVLTALGTSALGVVLARGVTRRIQRLGTALRVVAAGDLSVQVPVTGSDELTELAESFNLMIVEVSRSRARIEFLQRMGAWQEMAKRLAHEIKNPLTPIQLAVEECHRRYEGDDERFRQMLDTTQEVVREEIGTLRRLVESFANFARLPDPELEPTDLVAFVRDITREGDALRSWPTLELELPDQPVTVALDRQLWRRLVVNLLDNAAEARRDGQGGLVHIAVRRVDDLAGRGVELSIDDDGPGIDAALLPRVFDPYITTKETGTGLGLAIAKKIVVDHNGSIEASRSSLGGARFVMRLPTDGPSSSSLSLLEARQRLADEGGSFGSRAH